MIPSTSVQTRIWKRCKPSFGLAGSLESVKTCVKKGHEGGPGFQLFGCRRLGAGVTGRVDQRGAESRARADAHQYHQRSVDGVFVPGDQPDQDVTGDQREAEQPDLPRGLVHRHASAAACGAINKAGTTQLRLAITVDDNDDLGADYLGFYSGEAAAGSRPELVITYTP